MNSPILPILDNIFMENLEKNTKFGQIKQYFYFGTDL